MAKENSNNRDLRFWILKILERKYACADEILQALDTCNVPFENKTFYPCLSNLQIKKLLCTDWLKDNKGQNVKYYHLTKNGFDFIHHL